MHVTIKSKKHDYDLEFYGKINVLTGRSASRKTEFLSILSKIKRGLKNSTCKIIDGNRKLRLDEVYIYPNFVSVLNFYKIDLATAKNCLFVIDESSDMLRDHDVAKAIMESENYFIIVCRKLFGWLPVSVDSIYELEYKNGTIFNQPVYCKKNSDLTNIRDVNYIITEDSQSSRLFFKYHCSCEVFPGSYVDENGNRHEMNNTLLHSIAPRLSTDYKLLVVFDASAYGFYYDLLLKSMKHRKFSILAWDSYETYLLNCKPIGKTVTKEDIGCHFNSLGQYSYKLLCKEMKDYGKNFMPKEFMSKNFFEYPLTLLPHDRNDYTQVD